MHLGLVFLVLIVLTIGLSRWHSFASGSVGSTGQSIPWVIVLVALLCGGGFCLQAVHIPGRIAEELQRVGGDARRSRELRPMVGRGRIVEVWNTLIEQAQPSNAVVPGNNVASTVDSQVALMARAMRSVSAGIAVTDERFQIQVANGPLAALFNIESTQSLRDRNILEVLRELTNASPEPEESNAAIERLAGGGRAITVRIECGASPVGPTDATKNSAVPCQTVLRISRTRLTGRDSDEPGFAWLLQDITQQSMAAEARDKFLQTATHELRTPLANLRAYAEALNIESGVSLEEQKEFCNIITDETLRLSRLVDHLLTVGQMEAGSLVIQQHSLDPAKILEEAIENTRPQIIAAGLKLDTDISPKLRKIRGDKDKLQAVLVNLIGNAAKYTLAGGSVRISASLRGESLEVKVADTGIGIGPEDIPKVFEKFYRVQNDAVQNQTGNGLGLAFAREVARLHHGDIVLESQLGEGSVFTLTLPAPDEPSVSQC